MDAEDDFAAAAPAVGGAAEAGREKRESKLYAKKMMIERSRRLGTILRFIKTTKSSRYGCFIHEKTRQIHAQSRQRKL